MMLPRPNPIHKWVLCRQWRWNVINQESEASRLGIDLYCLLLYQNNMALPRQDAPLFLKRATTTRQVSL